MFLYSNTLKAQEDQAQIVTARAIAVRALR